MTARAWALFAAVSVLWGIPYLFIALAVDELHPAFVAFARVALGAAVLLPVAWRAGALRGLAARWRPLTAFAAIEIAVPFPLIAFGQQRVSSSLAAILIAALPLFVALVALRVDEEERVDGPRLAGLGVGLAGVVVLLGIDVAGSGREAVGAAAILVATFGYANGPMIVKRRLRQVHPLGPVTGALAIASVLLAPAGIATAPGAPPSGTAIVAIVVLGVACSALAFLCFFALIAAVGPSRASVIAYINPAVAVTLGVVVLGEDVGAGAVAGLLLILAGSWLATGGRLPPRPGLRRAPGAASAARP